MKGRLIVGIIDIIAGLACFILCIILNRTDRIMISLFPIAMGLGIVAAYISDKKQHKKQMEELAKMLGYKK